jgi:hypothetical protein
MIDIASYITCQKSMQPSISQSLKPKRSKEPFVLSGLEVSMNSVNQGFDESKEMRESKGRQHEEKQNQIKQTNESKAIRAFVPETSPQSSS